MGTLEIDEHSSLLREDASAAALRASSYAKATADEMADRSKAGLSNAQPRKGFGASLSRGRGKAWLRRFWRLPQTTAAFATGVQRAACRQTPLRPTRLDKPRRFSGQARNDVTGRREQQGGAGDCHEDIIAASRRTRLSVNRSARSGDRRTTQREGTTRAQRARLQRKRLAAYNFQAQWQPGRLPYNRGLAARWATAPYQRGGTAAHYTAWPA